MIGKYNVSGGQKAISGGKILNLTFDLFKIEFPHNEMRKKTSFGNKPLRLNLKKNTNVAYILRRTNAQDLKLTPVTGLG